MVYVVTSFNSVSDCDTLISQVTLDRNNLAVAKGKLDLELQNYSVNGDEFPPHISYLEQQITLAEQNIPTMPEGELRELAETNLYRLQLRLNLLRNKAENYGAFAQFERQYDIDKLERSIEAADSAIAALQARKAELEAQAAA